MIDLKPISACKELATLDLGENKLVYLDLEPLMKCKNLIDLDIGYNELTEINLEPLSFNENLKFFKIRNNNFESVDISPLRACKNLITFDVEEDLPIEWRDSKLDERNLPELLKRDFLKRIRVAHKKYQKELK